jgi:hypothetical protein
MRLFATSCLLREARSIIHLAKSTEEVADMVVSPALNRHPQRPVQCYARTAEPFTQSLDRDVVCSTAILNELADLLVSQFQPQRAKAGHTTIALVGGISRLSQRSWRPCLSGCSLKRRFLSRDKRSSSASRSATGTARD